VSVTIITPTLQAAAHLRDCLSSVRGQSTVGGAIEHLVIDGGSTDGTVELARAAGADVHIARGSSLYEALNRGVALALGDVVGWVNGDDALETGAVERVLRAFQRTPEADVVVGDWVMAHPSRPRVIRARADALDRIRRGCRRGTWVTPIAVFFRTEALRSLGPYDVRYRSAADLDLWIRAAARQPLLRVVHAGAVLGTFRVHPGSMSAGNDPRRSLVESMTIARAWYEDLRQEPGLRRYALFVYRRYAYQLRAWEVRNEPVARRAASTLRCLASLRRFGQGVLGDVRTPVTP
jgi:glycosyltransferase involved in cell wall biosynthesis